jgi:hypothetical protein
MLRRWLGRKRCCQGGFEFFDHTGKAMSLLDESLPNSRELGMRPLMEGVLLSRRDLLKA